MSTIFHQYLRRTLKVVTTNVARLAFLEAPISSTRYDDVRVKVIFDNEDFVQPSDLDGCSSDVPVLTLTCVDNRFLLLSFTRRPTTLPLGLPQWGDN